MSTTPLKLVAAACLALFLFACGNNTGIEKGMEYVYTAPDGTDTATMNDIVRTMTARFEAYGLSADDFEIATEENKVIMRFAPGNPDFNLRQENFYGPGNVTFYEMYIYDEVIPGILSADNTYSRLTGVPYDSLNNKAGSTILNFWQGTVEQNTTQTYAVSAGETPVFGWTSIAYCRTEDTAAFMAILTHDSTRICFPRNCEFRWCPVSPAEVDQPMCALVACKTGEGSRLIGGKMTGAQWEKISGMEQEIIITLDAYETTAWSRFTKDNIGKSIAIDVDGVVYSYFSVKTQISNGSAKITGGDEGMMHALYAILKGGQLPVPLTYSSERAFGL